MNWPLPPWEPQYSVVTHADAFDCTCESFTHIVYMLTGRRFSPRALAIMARVDLPQNRNVSHVLATANYMGLVDYNDCPTPDDFTFASYYQFDLSKVKVTKLNISLVKPDLNVSPLWTELIYGQNLPMPTLHMVAQISDTEYFDSEVGAQVKSLNETTPLGAPPKIAYQTSIKINQMNEAKIVKSKNSPTIYWCYPMPDMDYLQKKANLEGTVIPTTVPDTDSL